MKRLLIVCLLSGVFLTIQWLSARAAPTAPSSTLVCGTVSSDTTWTMANSPYEVCASGVAVSSGVALTVQPGVTVQFQPGVNAKLYVQGALSAIGTVTQPITFTGVLTTPGSWGGLSADNTVITPALVNLSYVTLDSGGIGSFGAQVYADRAVVTMTHSLVRNGGSDGLHFTNREAGLNIRTTSFISNNLYAIQLDTPATNIVLNDLGASSNGTNGVYLYAQGMNVAGQRHWSNPGIPYVINFVPTNHPGDELTIDPGSELQFMSNSGLGIGGQLKAIGLPDQPITFTAQTPTPGGWRGIVIDGGNHSAVAQLDYAAVEYGGGDFGGANIVVRNGQLIARHSIVRYSAKDGLQFGTKGGGSILNSQIVSNSQVVTTTYGVLNGVPSRAVLATNNWWGDPDGPTSDLAACSSGHGDRVSAGVLYRPVLTSTNLNAEFPLSDAPILTLTPRRWFAPADGLTRVYFDITLRDANGAPLPGRTVRLSTTLGTAVDGGITDASGKTLAYLTSGGAGDADVTASLDAATACEGALSPTSRVTFTPPLNITDLLPNAPASYFDGDIVVTPQPIIVGVTTTLRAKLTNPLTVPITVDASFGFVQSSIGLAFGPIKEFVGQVIPANSSVTLSAAWVPSVSGHYCVQVTYNITAIGSQRLLRPEAGGSGSKQLNLNPYPGPMNRPSDKDSLDKADKAFKKVEKLSPRGTNIQIGIIDRWWGWAKDTSKKISEALGGDPPRQDYTQISVPISRTWPPVQPNANISIARATALNATSAALADVNAYGTAAAIALDRYAGASEAHDLTWAAQQANARLYYQQQLGAALLTYADRLENFVQVLVAEGETNIIVTVGDVISYQQALSTTGFTAQEIADAKLIGLTDADIEGYRKDILAANPNDIAGNILDMYRNEVTISRNLGNALLHPYSYAPGFSISGGAGLRPDTTISNTLAQIYNTVSTIQLGNPLTQTATIDLRARRIDLPADWMVNVSPAQVTLAPGEQTTVTVNISASSLVPQGSLPRVAVEGYAGSQLLGGVVVEVVVPQYLPGFFRVFLPTIRR